MIDKVHEIIRRYRELEALLAAPEVSQNAEKMKTLGREYNRLSKNMPTFRRYLEVVQSLDGAREILAVESDPELVEMAREEASSIQGELPHLEDTIKLLLVPPDPDDDKNAILEVRAGTGGIEAGIFAGDLFRMYTHYAEKRGWQVEVLSASYGDLGSIKEVILNITGDSAFGNLKYESGVHRVQRVPQTETQGRIHTSAASVAVFPEVTEVEVQIDPTELRIDYFRSSGPGGQHVNKTESAVRIVHLPTGLMVSCQDEKSQHKNKARALKVLQSRLYERQQAEREQQASAARRSIIGSGDRSEKIRTYNFPQDRMTDHRIGLTLHNLGGIMDGDIQDIVDALTRADLEKRLQSALATAP